MTEAVLVGGALFALLAALVLGARSWPRSSVGPASAPRRRAMAFAAAALFVPSYIGLAIWLMETVPGWPDAYGTTCSGRGCTVEYLRASPALLEGGWREISLFAWLWSTPVVIALSLAIMALRSLRGRAAA